MHYSGGESRVSAAEKMIPGEPWPSEIHELVLKSNSNR